MNYSTKKTYEEALSFIDFLKFEIKNFPEPLQTYILNNFFPEYKKFLHFLKKEHKGKLDKDTNQTENYMGNILSKSEKIKFNTKIGLFSLIEKRINGWIKKRQNQPTT